MLKLNYTNLSLGYEIIVMLILRGNFEILCKQIC